MKTFRHIPRKEVSYIFKAVNHKAVCKPTARCIKCGRPICYGCTSTREERQGRRNVCIICSGQYIEEHIILHQPEEEIR
jgi:hypothetical protein